MKLIVNSRVALAGFFFSCSALAQQDADLDALKLADQMTIPSESPSNWRIFTEGALGEAQQRASGSFQPDQRLSFDVQYDNSLTRDWRFVFADRLDVDNPAGPPYNHTINTIKESYFSWQAESDLLFDFGRINDWEDGGEDVVFAAGVQPAGAVRAGGNGESGNAGRGRCAGAWNRVEGVRCVVLRGSAGVFGAVAGGAGG